VPARNTSQRAEQRKLREQMRGLGMSRAEIAAEMARRYRLRPRTAWRTAWGWTLEEAADRFNTLRARDAGDAVTSLTGSRLSEWENWPLSTRKPSVTGLCVLAEVYQCCVLDLIDFHDREKLPAPELLALGKTGTAPASSKDSRDQRGTAQTCPHVGKYDTRPGPGTELAGHVSPQVPQGLPVVPQIVAIRMPASDGYVAGPTHPGSGAEARGLGTDTGWPAAAHGLADARTFGLAMRASWPDVRLSAPVPDQGMDWLVRLPVGRTLDVAGALAVQAHPLKTAADDSVYLPVVGGHRLDQLAATSHRGMLAGVEEQPQEPVRLYGVDLRVAHRRIAQSPGVPSAVVIPRAYEIDDLTYGIIWAVTSLDDALLADDSALDQRHRQLREFEQQPQSSAGSQAAAGLSAAARLWLGSSFCARHILRHLASPLGLPTFWTREQTGEEACAWLLFRHKHAYLQQISGQFAGTADPLVRGFCVPEDAVTASARWERLLLFLSVALMESLGIRVKICTEPEYADVDGFVLLPGDRAIIATWVRAESIWCADLVGRSPAVRTFANVTGHASAHSVTEAATPGDRLAALAAYLGLDWPWLWRRCADLGKHGCAGLVYPRSRLLSTNAVDAALHFTGMLGRNVAAR